MRETLRLNDTQARMVTKLCNQEGATTYRVLKRLIDIGLDQVASGRGLFDFDSGISEPLRTEDIEMLNDLIKKQLGLSIETLILNRELAEKEVPGSVKSAREKTRKVYQSLTNETDEEI